MDAVFGAVVRWLPSSAGFFSRGYGDLDSFASLNQEMRAQVMRAAPPPPAKVVWDDAARVEGGVRVRMGGFVSPAERYLSPESRTARFMMVTPMHAAAEPTCSSTSYSSRGVAIIFPSTGDQWYWLRKRVATRLARDGVSSLLPCYPVYGERRPASQTQHLVATVAELGIASTAAAMEGAALVSWAAAQFPGVRICITGMSMGGSVALGAALAARQPVACCTLVAPACAEALCTGILSRRIDWSTLSGSSGRDAQQEQQHLVEQLKRGSVLNEFMEGVTPAPPHVRSVVQVVASDDAFVPAAQSQALQRLLQQLPPSPAAYRLIEVPHDHIGTILSRGHSVYAPAIVQSLQLMDA